MEIVNVKDGFHEAHYSVTNLQMEHFLTFEGRRIIEPLSLENP